MGNRWDGVDLAAYETETSAARARCAVSASTASQYISGMLQQENVDQDAATLQSIRIINKRERDSSQSRLTGETLLWVCTNLYTTTCHFQGRYCRTVYSRGDQFIHPSYLAPYNTYTINDLLNVQCMREMTTQLEML